MPTRTADLAPLMWLREGNESPLARRIAVGRAAVAAAHAVGPTTRSGTTSAISQSCRMLCRWMRRCTTRGSLGRGEAVDRSSSQEGQIPSTEVVLRPQCVHPVKSILMASLLTRERLPASARVKRVAEPNVGLSPKSYVQFSCNRRERFRHVCPIFHGRYANRLTSVSCNAPFVV